jgi:serine/threonine-protein kinase HipA
MGALEFVPALGPRPAPGKDIDIQALVDLASQVLTRHDELVASLSEDGRGEALRDILSVGTSAGGARAKAVIAWNPTTQEARSGQLEAAPGFAHWILKFDGVKGNKDKELEDPEGYGAIEFAYYKMASQAGITMTECRLLEENGRRHFMTRRFDRGSKLHMQSLGGLAHYDFNQPGAYSYEQAFMVMRRLGLPMAAVEQQFRRMVFNVVARNQDDHVKNIAFLMNRDGRWELSPAFDVTYAYQPSGRFTSQHQMSINGKRDNFTRDDFRQCAKGASMKRGRSDAIFDEVLEAVGRWRPFAEDANVDEEQADKIERAHRLDLPRA